MERESITRSFMYYQADEISRIHTRHVERMSKMSNSYQIVVRKSEGEAQLVDLGIDIRVFLNYIVACRTVC
jgi:hypothetical protein